MKKATLRPITLHQIAKALAEELNGRDWDTFEEEGIGKHYKNKNSDNIWNTVAKSITGLQFKTSLQKYARKCYDIYRTNRDAIKSLYTGYADDLKKQKVSKVAGKSDPQPSTSGQQAKVNVKQCADDSDSKDDQHDSEDQDELEESIIGVRKRKENRLNQILSDSEDEETVDSQDIVTGRLSPMIRHSMRRSILNITQPYTSEPEDNSEEDPDDDNDQRGSKLSHSDKSFEPKSDGEDDQTDKDDNKKDKKTLTGSGYNEDDSDDQDDQSSKQERNNDSKISNQSGSSNADKKSADNQPAVVVSDEEDEQELTIEGLEELHRSLLSRPPENTRADDPRGLTVKLMPHQKYALAWLMWREKEKPRGGVLADDMGLGKTLTMISLVIKTLAESFSDDEDSDPGLMSKGRQNELKGGTLLVCPASLIDQWKTEVERRCKRGVLTVEVYHGTNREKVARRLARNDMVITTYSLLSREVKKDGQLFQIKWKRVILDEAHSIRNHKSQTCGAVCKLNAVKRWALTGTPIQNKEMDLYAILKFLQCSPFDDLRVWKRWVDNKSTNNIKRLATVMKTLMLRRTKTELMSKGEVESLPEKVTDVIKVKLDNDERLVYDKVMLYSRKIFTQFLHQRGEKEAHQQSGVAGASSSDKNNKEVNKAQEKLLAQHAGEVKSSEILVLLLRLRQVCCHPSLIHQILDNEEMEMNLLKNDDALTDKIMKMDLSICTSEYGDSDDDEDNDLGVDKRITENLLTSDNPVFKPTRKSSKLRVICKIVKTIMKKNEKMIIVSQWTSFLNVIKDCLKTIPGATFEMFTGQVAVKNRQAIVDAFNLKKKPQILLLSLSAGGVGLNLVGANHLIFVDIHWNPQLESQAQDRIHRLGQNKNVFIYKILCSDTIEERIQILQEAKLEKAASVLDGSGKVSSKLTLQDMKSLFEM